MDEPKAKISSEAITNFLNGVISKANSMVQQVDTQTNILIGVNTAIFAFAVARFNVDQPIKPAFVVLGIFCGLAATAGLFSLHPPRFMRKKGQQDSLLLPSNISRIVDTDTYIAAMKHTTQDIDRIIEQYSLELYNLSKYYYIPKRKLYRVSRNLLLVGILASLIVGLSRV